MSPKDSSKNSSIHAAAGAGNLKSSTGPAQPKPKSKTSSSHSSHKHSSSRGSRRKSVIHASHNPPKDSSVQDIRGSTSNNGFSTWNQGQDDHRKRNHPVSSTGYVPVPGDRDQFLRGVGSRFQESPGKPRSPSTSEGFGAYSAPTTVEAASMERYNIQRADEVSWNPLMANANMPAKE